MRLRCRVAERRTSAVTLVTNTDREVLGAVAVVGALILIALLVFSDRALARDDGHWEERVGVEIAKWMGALMQLDTMWTNGDHMVGTPCCGDADAYWADDVHVYTSHDGDKCNRRRRPAGWS
jgi:hypothetical protein